jgi:hypothetical protein
MRRRLDDVRLALMMIDGLELQGRTNVVALVITTEGVKMPLGLWEGSTENATVATELLSDLVERRLDPEQGILFVIDGAKALRRAIRNVFGDAPVQRCLWHKERNLTEHLLERERPAVKQPLRRASALDDHARALDQRPRARRRARPLVSRRGRLAARTCRAGAARSRRCRGIRPRARDRARLAQSESSRIAVCRIVEDDRHRCLARGSNGVRCRQPEGLGAIAGVFASARLVDSATADAAAIRRSADQRRGGPDPLRVRPLK